MSGLSINKENSKNQKPETKIQDAKVEIIINRRK